ncbi:hypothetical protein PVAP13_3KG242627 [Panicum virgatum]|uniref:Uncharacterized protein n=1 Tax=Panicum virgatum TaxID=38727 RepID=A0A8T0UWR1_PANVG|nr:hypothetical protein PVAP13_3KG242627 [Panicum virgatum]
MQCWCLRVCIQHQERKASVGRDCYLVCLQIASEIS